MRDENEPEDVEGVAKKTPRRGVAEFDITTGEKIGDGPVDQSSGAETDEPPDDETDEPPDDE